MKMSRHTGLGFAILIFAVTGCTKPRQVLEVVVNCPHTTTFQAEGVAIAFEVALAGMPSCMNVDSISTPGQARIILSMPRGRVPIIRPNSSGASIR